MLPQLLRWLVITAAVGAAAGSASAGFLVALDRATLWRETHVWVIAALPLGAFAVGWIYHRFGKSVEGGNNLLLEQIHDPKSVIPLRMAPLVLFGTLASHLFGGSVGREGTAVQMGGTLADQLTGPLKLDGEDRRVLLMAGMAAGFASVFGTPLAGAVFGLEVLAIGRLRYDAIFPCFAAAIIADRVTLAWGVHHTDYHLVVATEVTLTGLLSAIVAGAVFGLVGMSFSKATHGVQGVFKKFITYPPLRALVGGVLVAAGVWALGSTKYIGLGLPSIVDSFHVPEQPWAFVLKLAFTAVSLGSGMKGGEVTPLFFIGATLGNTLSRVLALPMAVLAGMGFVGVFAGAANTPLACTLMAVELFGSSLGVYAGIACVASYLFSGHTGIYHAQRVGSGKYSR